MEIISKFLRDNPFNPSSSFGEWKYPVSKSRKWAKRRGKNKRRKRVEAYRCRMRQLATAAGSFLREKLTEESFLRKAFPVETLS